MKKRRRNPKQQIDDQHVLLVFRHNTQFLALTMKSTLLPP